MEREIVTLCIHCGDLIPRPRTNKLYCSGQCSNIVSARRRGNQSPLSREFGIATGTLGALNELFVAVDLMKRGYDVFRALSPACPSDLVTHKDGQMLRVEVKTGYRTPDGRIVSVQGRCDTTRFDVLATVIGSEIIYAPPQIHDSEQEP